MAASATAVAVESRRATTRCVLADAERCFTSLFEEMPICSNLNATRDVTFRCQHFNVLDTCFRASSLICLPNAIGHAAKVAYQRRVFECNRIQQQKHFAALQQQRQEHQKQQHQHQMRHRNANNRSHHSRSHLSSTYAVPPPAQPLGSPSELQFISLLGYLQIRCRRNSGGATTSSSPTARRAASGEGPPPSRSASSHYYCTGAQVDEFVAGCEADIRQRNTTTNGGGMNGGGTKAPSQATLDLERHQLLRKKLEASSRLLEFVETKRDEECLMVRAVLSDIFTIHQAYCIQSAVTRCICQHYNFGVVCGIECANLEAFGLPFQRRVSWAADFRGRLVGSSGMRPSADALPLSTIILWISLSMFVPLRATDFFDGIFKRL